MSLSTREARVLGGIEDGLSSDARLVPLFDTFTRLTRDEPISPLEQLRSRRSRMLAALLLPVILLSGICAALSGGRGHSPSWCREAPVVLGLHWRDRGPCPAKPGRPALSPAAGHQSPRKFGGAGPL